MANRTILGFLIIALCILATTAVAAAETITVTQGETVRIVIDARIRGEANANELSVSVPAMRYVRALRQGVNDASTLEDTFVADIAPGRYSMSVRVGRNGETLRFSQYTLEVRARGTTTPTTRVITIIPAPVAPESMRAIKIDPIPDKLAGESFVLPVTITGTGTYTVEIPLLGFAHYEAPNPARITNEETIPVLIRLHDDIAPGLYIIPITVGDETTSVRIRVIKYNSTNANWLIPVGVALIVAALLILLLWSFQNKRQHQPPRPPKTPENDDEKLITYY